MQKGPPPKHTNEQYLAFDPGAGDDFPAEVECRKTALIITRFEHTCFGTGGRKTTRDSSRHKGL